MTKPGFRINVHNGDIIVWSANPGFIASYYKPQDQPQLLLRHRTRTDDHELLAGLGRLPTPRRASLDGSSDRQNQREPLDLCTTRKDSRSTKDRRSPRSLKGPVREAGHHRSGEYLSVSTSHWRWASFPIYKFGRAARFTASCNSS